MDTTDDQTADAVPPYRDASHPSPSVSPTCSRG